MTRSRWLIHHTATSHFDSRLRLFPMDDVPSLADGRIASDGARMSRRLSAYHEAAHAVVAQEMGCTVEHVKIAAKSAQGGKCVHVTPETYQVPDSRPISGTPFRQETTQPERTAMALRQRDVSTATAALAGVALEDIARAVPALDLLLAREVQDGTTLEGQRLRSRSDIGQAGEAARRQHRSSAGRDQFFRRARARATRIMLANWPSVTAVAEALLEHGTLDGQTVEHLLQAAMRRRSPRRAVRGPGTTPALVPGRPAVPRM